MAILKTYLKKNPNMMRFQLTFHYWGAAAENDCCP